MCVYVCTFRPRYFTGLGSERVKTGLALLRTRILCSDSTLGHICATLGVYRENFERLLDDKTFKTEVVLFSVDEESTEIKPEHRQELLPYLMR